ncbi:MULTISPECIES: hypothetical protein [Cupriavidus]|nr:MULTISPECIES: hypothetical protein [Cupriavidus]
MQQRSDFHSNPRGHMDIFTRNAGLADPVLSDEAAFFIQLILDDIWLWFNTVYGEQARRYRPPPDLDPDDDPDPPF